MASRSTSRSRNLKRKFILLRWVDPFKVPSNRTSDVLERSGRIKEVVFSNNSTNEHVSELVLHAFQQHLVADDIPR